MPLSPSPSQPPPILILISRPVRTLFRHDPQFEDVDSEIRAVMQNRVNAGVRAKYESENVKFILWLFDDREHYLQRPREPCPP